MIFISHRQTDETVAKAVGAYLARRNIAFYLDVLDPVRPNPMDITKHIVDKIQRCTHMIAVFSQNTTGSLWVPFELGVAFQANKGIGTFATTSLPEYLRSFPVMTSETGLALFIEEYNRHREIKKSIDLREDTISGSSYAESFAVRLKSRLGQG